MTWATHLGLRVWPTTPKAEPLPNGKMMVAKTTPKGLGGSAATLLRLGVVWPPSMSQILTFFIIIILFFLTPSGWFQPS